MADFDTEPKLIVVTGPLIGETMLLTAPEATIGRDAANTICIADTSLSRRHCALTRRGDSWHLLDLGSSNGTFVNSVPVNGPHVLAEGDRITAGESTLLFRAGAPPGSRTAVVTADEPLTATARVGLDEITYLQRSRHGASREEQGLRALLAMSALVNTARSEAELLAELLNIVQELVPADEAAVVLVEGGALRVAASAPARPDAVRVNRTAVERVATDRAGLLGDSAGPVPGTDLRARPAARSLLCAPIAMEHAVFGVVHLARHVPAGTFDEEHLQLVTALGRHAASALVNLRHIAALEHETEALRAGITLDHNIVGESAPMRAVFDRIGRVARADTTVLIVGETGTGKELAARAIHTNSPRAKRPFVAVNCAALVDTLLESELFGHERGAFSGAVSQKKGKFEIADGGTLFLDEIGEVTPSLQSKLLRVLQEREFERVGGTRVIKTDVRILSATNRTLSDEVAAGRFRPDLYFRLNVVSIAMPPLRERRADIPLLARHVLARHARKAGRRITGFSAEATERLMAHDWPGNVRELENAIERAVVLGFGSEILVEDLPDDLGPAARHPSGAPPEHLDFHRAVLETKKRTIVEAFRKAGGSYVETARILGVHPNYLHRLVRTLELKSVLENGS